jgi:hypothetical protein
MARVTKLAVWFGDEKVADLRRTRDGLDLTRLVVANLDGLAT